MSMINLSSISSRLCWASMLGLAIPVASTLAQDSLNQVYSDGTVRRQFVFTSLGWTASGTACESVLQALLTVAKTPNASSEINLAAVRAAFHIAGSDSLSRQWLMSIINDANAEATALEEALRLIIFVADEGLTQQLRQIAISTFPSLPSNNAIRVLSELGDAGTLAWLDQRLAGSLGEFECLRGWISRVARRIRVQQNVALMLNQLASQQSEFDRGWLVHQARRHGSTLEQIHAAVISYLTAYHLETTGVPAMHLSSLIRACDEYGIFTSSDVDQLAVISYVRRVNSLTRGDHLGELSWATATAAKRAAFFQIPYTQPPIIVPTTLPALRPPVIPPQPWTPNEANFDAFAEWMGTINWEAVDEQEVAQLLTEKMCELDLISPQECAQSPASAPSPP